MESKHEMPEDLNKRCWHGHKVINCAACAPSQDEFIERIASLEAALAEARSQIEAAHTCIEKLCAEKIALEAQLADCGKPVKDEERERFSFDGGMRMVLWAEVNALIASRTQSRQEPR